MMHQNHTNEVAAAHRSTGAVVPSPIKGRLPTDPAPLVEVPHDILDTPECRRLIQDTVEAITAEMALYSRLGPAVRVDQERYGQKRRVVLDMVRSFKISLTDADIRGLFDREWTPEHTRLFGSAPSPSMIRRWCRMYGDGVGPTGGGRTFPGAKAGGVCERAFLRMKRAIEEKALDAASLGRSASADRRRSGGRHASAATQPAIGQIVQIGGVDRRYLGRTLAGRSAYAELSAPAGRRPAVRIEQFPDARGRNTDA